MHEEQKEFCKWVRRRFRARFLLFPSVIDVGSLDINGTNRYLFTFPSYKGVDICPGKNVNIAGRAMDVLPTLQRADIVISTEMLEHDKTWEESLLAMYRATKEDGLLIITCAGEGRHEHGTSDHSPQDSPSTNDYYQNISLECFPAFSNRECFRSIF